VSEFGGAPRIRVRKRKGEAAARTVGHVVPPRRPKAAHDRVVPPGVGVDVGLKGGAPPAPRDLRRDVSILRAAQRALLRARDEAELLDLICGIAVNEAGYRMAWAGFAEDDAEKNIRPIAWAGVEAGYLEAIRATWSETPQGRGPAGTAVRTNRPALGRNFATDPDLRPWRQEARKHGFASTVALPLRTETVPFGLLAIYATTPDAFSASDVELLANLADDLAFGINTLRARSTAEVGQRRSERNLVEAQRISHIGSWEWDFNTGTAIRSDELHRIYGVEPGTIPPTNEAFLAFVHPDDRARVRASERAAITSDHRYALEYRAIRPDGTIRLLHDEAEVVRDPGGAIVRMTGTVQDITERVSAEAERATLVAAIEQTADAIWIKDVDGIVTYANRAFSEVYGYEPHEIVGQFAGMVDSGHHTRAFFDAIWAQVTTGKTWTGVIVNRRKDGELVELEAVISGIRDASGQTLSFMQTDRDVTRERALEETIRRRAREQSMIEAALAGIDSNSSPEAIAKVACAELIQLPIVDGAFVIALSDEDHALVIANDGPRGTSTLTSNVLPASRAKYLFERASRGVWTEDWHARAEDGAYGVQMAGTGVRTVAYAPLLGSRGLIGVVGLAILHRDRAAFIEQLPVLTTLASILGPLLSPGLEARNTENSARARTQGILDASAFSPFFQPIIELHTGRVTGYEALSRFDDGVPPDITFALAVRCGLGLELEAATIRAALEASTILPLGKYLGLNVSPALIGSGRIPDLLAGVTREIVLEITEHEATDDYPALRAELASLGPTVRTAVDDAGAGYASLRHILELSPSFVKLDIALIRGINADPARQALIAGMGYFALKRKQGLIAEGIETTAELKTLQLLGVGFGQGFLLGRPQSGVTAGPWPTVVPMPGVARTAAGTPQAR
jgi:PAS domain S-box-containing protein